MKNVRFLLFLFSFISCDATDSEFRFQNSFPVGKDSNCISAKDCFSLDNDSNFFYTMCYSHNNGNKQSIDTVNDTDLLYGSTLNSFKLQENNSYVILWKIKHEFTPSFNAYYVRNGKIIKIGEWGMFTPCETCDIQDYSIEDVLIYQRNGKIEFLFSKDVEYIDYGEDIYRNNWVSYKAGTLTFSFDITNMECSEEQK